MDSLKDAKQKTSEFVSPSLILTPPANYNFRDYPGFDLGVGDEWMGLSPVNDGDKWLELVNGIDVDELLEESPPKKKPHLCLSLKKKESRTSRVFEDSTNTSHIAQQSRRFALPVSKSEVEKAVCGVVPANTQFNTQWAERNFTAWAMQRNLIVPDNPVPLDLLSSHDPVLVSKHLQRFVMETRNTNGESYTPATLRSLLSGRNRILKANKAPFSIFSKEDPAFRNLMLTMDSLSSDLHSKGIGAQ